MKLVASIAIVFLAACGAKQSAGGPTTTSSASAAPTTAVSDESMQPSSPPDPTPEEVCDHAYGVALHDRPDDVSKYPTKSDAMRECLDDLRDERKTDPRKYHCQATCVMTNATADAIEACGKAHHCD